MHLRRLLVLLLGVIAALVIVSGPAAAHTGFDSSDPADGAVLDEPVDTVTLRFTGEAEPVGSGFEVLDAGGAVRSPTAVSSDDGSTWVLRFEPPLAGGPTGVRWAVKAPDAHPIEGSFSFQAGGVPAGARAGNVGESDLESFLVSVDGPSTGNRFGAVGRILSIVGTLIGVGALVFAATVLRGSERDVLEVMFWVRRAGLLVMGGATLEVVGQATIEVGGSWSAVASPSALWSGLASWTGLAIVLRLSGGLGLLTGARSVTVQASGHNDVIHRVGRLVGAAQPVGEVHGGGHGPAPGGTGTPRDGGSPDQHRAWVASRESAAAVAGAAALVASFAFDGHTASKGLWPVHGLTDIVHVTAAAVWVGGVAMVTVVCRSRRQRGVAIHAAQLGLRFSVVATVALVTVAVAGLVLSVTILDAPSDLLSTAWGRLLLVKLALVAAAAGAGAYNHRVLVPALQERPNDPALIARFRQVVAKEAVVLLAAGTVTAWLVGSAA